MKIHAGSVQDLGMVFARSCLKILVRLIHMHGKVVLISTTTCSWDAPCAPYTRTNYYVDIGTLCIVSYREIIYRDISIYQYIVAALTLLID